MIKVKTRDAAPVYWLEKVSLQAYPKLPVKDWEAEDYAVPSGSLFWQKAIATGFLFALL